MRACFVPPLPSAACALVEARPNLLFASLPSEWNCADTDAELLYSDVARNSVSGSDPFLACWNRLRIP